MAAVNTSFRRQTGPGEDMEIACEPSKSLTTIIDHSTGGAVQLTPGELRWILHAAGLDCLRLVEK